MTGIPAIAPYPLPVAGDLPANVADWQPHPERAVLLLHDMQRYFLAPFPAELRDPLVGNAAALRERCAAQGVPVTYTAQPGGMTDAERGLLRDFWGPGMRVDPADRRIVDELAPAPGDRVFTKWRYSAFHRSGLLAWLRYLGRDQLVLAGVYAQIGVLMTAVEAFSHDVQVFLVADAIADFDPDSHRSALSYAARRCAVVTTAKEVLP
jgi:isochorismate hydrolase